MNDYTGKCLFGNWYIPDFSKPMGKGSFGTVYELHSYDGMNPTAVKIISLPKDEYDYIQSFSTLKTTKKGADERFYQTKDKILDEIAIMYKVSGHTNCASIMAYEVVDHEDCFGWDILIQMEKLESLGAYYRNKSGQKITSHDVIRLGIDICNALELCAANNVVHRDIKPANIMVKEIGNEANYKLTDFGVSGILRGSGTMTIIGTLDYMAPEMLHGKGDSRVDIYSLGIVLYELLNANRLPFLPNYPEPYDAADIGEARTTRWNGKTSLPEPLYAAGTKLGEVVVKACQLAPEQRFSSAAELRKALQSALEEEEWVLFTISPDGELVPAEPIVIGDPPPEAPKPPKASKALLAAMLAVFIAAAALLAAGFAGTWNTKDSDETMLLLHLEPQEDASYADVQHDMPIITGRLKAISEDIEVTISDDKSSLDAVIPLSCLFTDDDFQAVYFETDVNQVIKGVISNPMRLGFARTSIFSMWSGEDAAIDREEIQDIKTMTVGEANTAYGMPLDVENLDGTITQLRKDYICLIITLTEEAAEEIPQKVAILDKNASEADVDVSTWSLNLAHIEGDWYPVTVALEDGVSYAVVQTDWYEYESWDSEALARSLVYSYTHDELKGSFDFSYELSPSNVWEDTAEAEILGEFQCNLDELPEDTVTFNFLTYSTATDEEYEEAVTSFKAMLDIIGEPYAFGRGILDAYSISVCTVPDKLNFGIVDLLCCLEPSFRLNGRESYDTREAINMYSLKVSSSEIVCDETTGLYELVVTVSDPAELETVTGEILEFADRKNLYLADSSSGAFVGASLDGIISDGKISFNQLPLLRMDKIPEEYRYILELIQYKLDRADYNDRRGVYANSYYLDSYSTSNDNVRFGVRAEADDALAAFIEENYPGVHVSVKSGAAPELYIQLHQELKSGFISEAFDEIEAIFQETQLDSLEYYVMVYLIDETGDMLCRVSFYVDTWGGSQYLECTGICMGDWLDVYETEFEKEMQSREFFTKRNTSIRTNTGYKSLTS